MPARLPAPPPLPALPHFAGRTALRAGLDRPLPEPLCVGSGCAIIVSGWCFHPRQRITRLDFTLDGRRFSVDLVGVRRPDLLLRFPDANDPQRHRAACGFHGLLPLSPGLRTPTLGLRAALADGSSARVELARLDVRVTDDGDAPERVGCDRPWPPARVAICLTTANPEPRAFGRLIRSLRTQTESAWVAVIVDDASSPTAFADMLAILGDDARFRVYRNRAALGTVRSFELALRAVPTEVAFVAVAGVGDEWPPERLAERAALWRRDLLGHVLPFPPGFTDLTTVGHWLSAVAGATGDVVATAIPQIAATDAEWRDEPASALRLTKIARCLWRALAASADTYGDELATRRIAASAAMRVRATGVKRAILARAAAGWTGPPLRFAGARVWAAYVRSGLPAVRRWLAFRAAVARAGGAPGFVDIELGSAMNDTATQAPGSIVAVERGTEPFSGLPMIWAGGLLPGVPFDPATRVEVYYDDVFKVWLPTRPLEPEGCAFDIQIIQEPAAQRVSVFLRTPDATTKLLDRFLGDIYSRDSEPGGRGHTVVEPSKKPPTRVGYTFRLVKRHVKAGTIFSPVRWHHWGSKVFTKLYNLLPAPPAPTQVHVAWQHPRRPDRSPYDAYIANTRPTPRRRAAYETALRDFRDKPTFSVLMPVYDVDVCWIRHAVESVRAQLYPHWQLCLADDASTKPELLEYLRGLRSDPRIKVTFRPKNGHICHASNSAADLATGEYVCFMDNDDYLEPDALFHYARLLQRHADADLIYSDEDKVDSMGVRYDPQFKPDWSPELFLSYNYVNHFTCMRRSLFESIGRFRPGYEGGQDYDLLLRAVERTEKIHHVPRVLYHWRSLPTSTASAAGVKPIMFTSVERSLRDHLARTHVPALTAQPPVAERLRLPIHQLEFDETGPSVAVVVPVCDDAPLDPLCLASVLEQTRYEPFRVILLDCTTDGVEPLTGVEIHRDADSSPTGAIDKLVRGLTDDFVCVLAPSLEVRQSRWLARLVGYAGLSGVGCTGGRVVDSDGRVRHAGIVLNQYDETAPARCCYGLPPEAVSYYFLAEVARPVSALAGDCLLVRRSTYLEVGGFDAERYPGSGAAIEFCRALDGRGLRSVYVAGAEFRDHAPEPARDDPREILAMLHEYGRERDRYFNPNLSTRFGFVRAQANPLPPELPGGRPVKVLFAAHNLNAAEGAPRYLFDIADGLQRRGRVNAFVFSPMEGPGRQLYDDVKIPVHIGEMPHAHHLLSAKWQPKEYATAVDYATRMIQAVRPGVVVANTLCNFPLVEAAYRAEVPSVWIIHESYTPAQMKALHTPFALARCHAAFTLADRVLIASHDTANLFHGADRRNAIEVIHNGLAASDIEEYIRAVTPEEAKEIVPGPAGRKRIVAVGTVCERKGQHTLVQAAAMLRRKGRRDFCVYLVGVRETSLSYLNYVKAIIEREKLHDFVRLIPETNDVRPYWRSSDIFVCSSHVEAFSRSMLEAEAFGLPVVTTPCCGANEQVVWDRNAFCFPMGDARTLAKHLDKLLADDNLRREMGACSRAVYDCHLTNDDMLDRYERLILNVWLHADSQELPASLKRVA